MAIDLSGTDALTRKAVAHYWRTLELQGARNRNAGSNADRGARAAVTGGRQMDGFCELIRYVLLGVGLTDGDIYLDRELELPGYFRPTKKWDMLVVQGGVLLAAMEFKSQRGPSFGNNFNNRSEEAVGTAQDLATAFREGAFGKHGIRPWAGWVMLLEECDRSTQVVGVAEPHFKVFGEFRDASYMRRYELLLRKLVLEKLYDSSAFLVATESGGPTGEFREPATDLTMKKFLGGLAGHIGGYLAGK
ncbi:MAG TPA: PaeR7I family type II restriction endonuclease [Steroidobacteraceae bacterium]|nr:PaeR7I family type II restriction endonuclease [Steroidobacteraceae bacterium]